MATMTKEKKSKPNTLSFWTTGEGMTELVRNSWVSDTPKHALLICKESLGMTTEQALELITGKKKLIGDTREGDGCLGWEDDNTTEVCGIKLDVQTMIDRLEKYYIEASEAINLFNSNDDLNDNIPYEFEDNEKSISYYKKKVSDALEQLEVVYSLVGKSMKDLPVNKVRSAPTLKREAKWKNKREEISERNLYETRFTRSMNALDKSQGVLNNMLENIRKQNEEDEQYDENDINRPFRNAINNGTFYIVHCSPEKCKAESLHAGWLLPDGTFFAGDSIWIHRGILDELSERDWFKDKGYSSDEDDVQKRGNWIKFSGNEWFIWEYQHNLTKEQIEFIIQYTTEVDEKTHFKCSGRHFIHVTVFAKLLDGLTQFNSFRMSEESEPIIEAEKEASKNDVNNELANFPTVDEVSEIDPLSTPFFQPDAKFVKWLINYANGRMIIDCGAGSGYLTAMIHHLGYKNCIAIEPHFTEERKMFWFSKGYHFHVFYKGSQEEKIICDIPDNNVLLLFARPCHNGFVYETITKNMPEGTEALYISHKGNEKTDLMDLKYTKINHEGSGKSNEYVLSIKK